MNCLNENFIVHMAINDTYHWSVVKQISDDYIILADSNLGIINYTKEGFSGLYTNNSIIISKSFIDKTTLESKSIKIITDKNKLLISAKKVTTKKTKHKQFKTYYWGIKWRWVYVIEYYKSIHYGSSYLYVFQYSKIYKYGSWNKIGL